MSRHRYATDSYRNRYKFGARRTLAGQLIVAGYHVVGVSRSPSKILACEGIAEISDVPESLTDAAIKSCISANLTGLILMSEACCGPLIKTVLR